MTSSPAVQPGPDEPRAGRRFAGRWALKNAMIIDGTGGPAFGPAHIVIEDGRIQGIVEPGDIVYETLGGTDPVDLLPPENVIDLDGSWVLPGLIDSHAHIGHIGQVDSAGYVYKLWIGHGITTVREVGALHLDWDFVLSERARSEKHEIVAPYIEPYLSFGAGLGHKPTSPDEARAWVHDAAERGAIGVKFFGAAPDVFRAALNECGTLGLQSACHHAQKDAPRTNALNTARWGLNSIEHSYGQAEVMFRDRLLPDLPANYNYSHEHDRFAYAGRLWAQAEGPQSAAWNDFLDELVALGTTLVPTFSVYVASRDADGARTRPWHDDYTLPRLGRYFTPDPHRHGSFFFDWGTEEEVAWRNNYRIWMQFVRDFSLRGGRVCAGSDAGFIYNLYGFGLIQELELLRESGMDPLEVIRSATLAGAEVLQIQDQTGSIEVGKRADLVILDENPLANLKVLYGNGHYRMTAAGRLDRVGGVRHTVKGGVIYDAARARADVRDMVSAAKSDLPDPR